MDLRAHILTGGVLGVDACVGALAEGVHSHEGGRRNMSECVMAKRFARECVGEDYTMRYC